MTQKVKDMAPKIWEAIQKSNNVLLHFHPSPDPDTVGSSLAMLAVLEKMGKHATVIKGDSELPNWVKFLPGSDKVLSKNYTEINPLDFDLFLIMDTASQNQITKLTDVKFPDNMITVVIDHHLSNQGFGKINLIDTDYIANCHLMYDLLMEWKVEITPEIVSCLFLGIYTDSGGFKYPPTNSDTFLAASELSKIYPDFYKLVFDYENSNDKEKILFEGLALNNIETFFNGQVAIALVTLEQMKEKGIKDIHTMNTDVPNILKSVIGWDIGISFVQKDPESISCSFRTRNPSKYDLSKIALALGGGGHKAASGAQIKKPFDEAKKYLLEKLTEVYPDLGKP